MSNHTRWRLDPQTLHAIDLFLEDIYEDSITAGNQMVSSGLKNSQIRGLETLITSTSRFSEVINYIKNQTGKDRKITWLNVGPLLLEQLEKLEEKANELGAGDVDKILAIKMKLARGWAKQVVCHYLFSASQK